MTVKVSKSAINLREKLAKVDNISLENFKAMDATFSGRVGIGTTVPARPFHALAVDDPSRFERTTATTADEQGVLELKATTSGDMGNNFGPYMSYVIEDNAATANVIGYHGFRRTNSQDNSSQFFITTYNGGTEVEGLVIDRTGNVGIGTASPVSFGANTAGLTVNASSGSHITWQNNGTNVASAFNVGVNFLIGSEQPSSDTILLSSGAERMRIDSSGNLYCSGGSGGTILTLTASSGTTGGDIGRIRFGNNDIDSNLVNIVAFQDGATDSGALKFETQPTAGANTERMRIGSDGAVSVKWGGTTSFFSLGGVGTVNGVTGLPSNAGTPLTLARDTGTLRSAHFAGHLKFDSGYGVQFDVAGGTGTSTSSVLDDYEEGTWTPVLVGSTTEGTASFVTGPIGTYTKVGRLVTITFDWNISGHTGAGALRINGLPFALGTGTGVGSILDGNYTYSSGRTKLVPYVASSSILRIYQTGDGLGYIENVLDTSHQLQGTVTYFTS